MVKVYSQIWNHFKMLPCKTRARCYHCDRTITCFRHGTSNCKRHLARKHPSFYDGKDYAKFTPLEEETLDEPELDSSNFDTSFLSPPHQIDDDYTLTETQFVDCPSVSRKQRKKEPKPSNDTKPTSSKILNESPRNVRQLNLAGVKEEFDADSNANLETSEQLNQSYIQEIINSTNLGVQSTLYATNIALQLDNLGDLQRIIAEKLISDVIYNAKLEHLTEDAMVIVRVGTFENDSGELS